MQRKSRLSFCCCSNSKQQQHHAASCTALQPPERSLAVWSACFASMPSSVLLAASSYSCRCCQTTTSVPSMTSMVRRGSKVMLLAAWGEWAASRAPTPWTCLKASSAAVLEALVAWEEWVACHSGSGQGRTKREAPDGDWGQQHWQQQHLGRQHHQHPAGDQ